MKSDIAIFLVVWPYHFFLVYEERTQQYLAMREKGIDARDRN